MNDSMKEGVDMGEYMIVKKIDYIKMKASYDKEEGHRKKMSDRYKAKKLEQEKLYETGAVSRPTLGRPRISV